MGSHSPKLPELLSARQRGHWKVLRRIAFQSADLGIPPSLDWVIERVAEHGYPYREIDGEQWLRDIPGVIELLRPAARRKQSSFGGDVILATATCHTFQHRDLAQNLERWHLEDLDNVPTPH